MIKPDRIFKIVFRLLFYVLLSPIFIISIIFRSRYYYHRLFNAARTTMTCHNCGQQIPLVGMWRCKCGYQYTGQLLKPCPICHTVPKMTRCPHCGVTYVV